MNKPLLNKVKKFIRENPEKFDMLFFGQHHDCGCVAHHALALDRGGEIGPVYNWKTDAQKALHLRESQANRLFFVGSWPKNYGVKYMYAESVEEKAKFAIRRINHFMKTGK